MSSINVFNCTGNVGRDSELKWTATEKAILTFPLAIDTGTKEKPETTWLNCGLWGNYGQAMEAYIKKGCRIAATGSIRLRKYQGNNGEGQSLDFTIQSLEVINRAESSPSQASGGGFRSNPAPSSPPKQSDFVDDDIPF